MDNLNIETEDNTDSTVNPSVKVKDTTLSYSIEDNPPWYLGILLGFQHYLTMFGSTLTIPIVLAPALCVNDEVAKGKLISTIFFMSGIATLFQVIFGNRLPIVQSGTFSYLIPAFAILSTPEFVCPPGFKENPKNSTFDGIWKKRMLEIQGAIMVSSLFQMIIGFSGLIGFLLRFIGPITVAPTISLVGLSLFGASSNYAGSHWGIASLTIGMIMICSLILPEVQVPFPVYSKARGFSIRRLRFFKLFPVIIAIVISWLFCLILTESGALGVKSRARTDIRSSVLSESPWFRVPYPGQWGVPTVSVASVFGMLAGVFASIIESIGDYYACANLCGAPPPPSHAINRGIGVEGVTCLLAGSIGTGSGTTSYSENIGAIGITRVGSRRVVQYGAICMIVLGIFGKFGALFSTIPDPVIGGVFCCMFGMITAVGISNLKYVDLNSVRNLFIVGFAFFMGFTVPDYFTKNKNAIDTGSTEFDQILTVLLKTSMGVAGIIAVVLDNLVPGTQEERGLVKWKQFEGAKKSGNKSDLRVYELPFGIGNNWKISKYLPFLPYHPKSEQPELVSLQQYQETKTPE